MAFATFHLNFVWPSPSLIPQALIFVGDNNSSHAKALNREM